MLLKKTNSLLQNVLHAIWHSIAEKSTDRLIASDALFYSRPRDPKHILQAPTHQYSQNYEDAIIAEIFKRIGEKSKLFVEVGVFDGIECNSRALLERGWSGVWIDGNKEKIQEQKKTFSQFIEAGQLKIVEAYITTNNIENLIAESLNGRMVDFFSLDIDYNTSHAWRAVKSRARVACIEYNSSCPPTADWEVPYDPVAQWDYSNFFGASLKVFEKIGLEKDMYLVGCDFHGVNAFFVNKEECGSKFLMPYTAENHFEPPRYKITGHRGHPARR